jgi:hypothetical protein
MRLITTMLLKLAAALAAFWAYMRGPHLRGTREAPWAVAWVILSMCTVFVGLTLQGKRALYSETLSELYHVLV